MSELTMMEEDAAGPWVYDEAPPMVLAPEEPAANVSPYEPPEGRDTATDAEVFGHYAEVDCGEGALATPSGSCEPIAGYDEGMAAADALTRYGLKLSEKKGAEKAAVRARTSPAERAMNECIAFEQDLAQQECAAGRLPTMAKPDGMSADECERLARDGWAGGSLARTDLRQKTTGETQTDQVTGSVRASATILGTGTDTTVGASTATASSTAVADSTGTTKVTNDVAFPGYVKGCLDDVRLHYPHLAGASK